MNAETKARILEQIAARILPMLSFTERGSPARGYAKEIMGVLRISSWKDIPAEALAGNDPGDAIRAARAKIASEVAIAVFALLGGEEVPLEPENIRSLKAEAVRRLQ